MNRRMDDRTLQRLVDGELSSDDYRGVLRAMDDEPDAWKRCALLFLEDQALRRDLGTCGPEALAAAPARVAPASKGAAESSRHFWAAIVAGFLLAFLGGYYLRFELQRMRQGPGAPPPLAARPVDKNALPSPQPQVAADSSMVVDPEYVTLVMDGPDGTEPERISLPIYPWQEAPMDWADNDQSPLPPQIHEALERMGSQITREHFWAPTTLSDGRRVLIPLEQVNITPPSIRPVSY